MTLSSSCRAMINMQSEMDNTNFELLYASCVTVLKASASVFTECPAECEVCVNSETCTRCRPGLYQLSGRCHHVCPEDFEPNDTVMECTAQGQPSIDKLKYHCSEPRQQFISTSEK